MEISWGFLGFSWRPIIAFKAYSHSWPLFVGFRWNFFGPTPNKLVQYSDVPALPAVENMREPTALESTDSEENIFRSQAAALHPNSHVRGQ